ncbi:MAG: type transport system ATP-binding protein [Solirubrobacteraceae bacterium]|jgi:ABC-2 type transport system ATP-binding protein|nr:type transport system ATP-binding protein [Solirubrobacteraceae bacterium]
MAVLNVQNVTKSYGATQALKGVSLSIEPGELVGLLGPNGAGKSTFVKIACGLVRATSGTATIDGDFGYLAELFRFPDWATADEVLTLHQELQHAQGGAPEREQLLHKVGLPGEAKRKMGTMSKGMQQRLGLAQAMIGDPKLLLLDEPTSALDPAGRQQVRRLLEDLRQQRVAVLLNSHLLSEVEQVCDRVAIIDHGEVVAAGTPAELSTAGGVEIETAGGIKHWPDATREDVPKLVADLVAQGEQIYAVRLLRSSLEDAYLKAVAE